MDLLGKLARSVADAASLEELTRPLLELLEAVTGLSSTFLTRVDDARGVQIVLFSRNTSELSIPEGLTVVWEDTLCKRALEEGQLHCDDVPSRWGDSQAARELGIQTYVTYPVLQSDGRLFGTLCGVSAARVKPSLEATHVLGLFAKLIALYVEREQALSSLREANAELTARVSEDPLTQVANRRALMMTLERDLAKARRDGCAVHVAFVDLDGFKGINDTYGHAAGDRFLVAIAQALVRGLRASDFVARIGGDEFVVVASARSSEDTEGAEQLRLKIASLTRGRFELGPTSLDYEGPSIGVVTSTPGETSAAALVARADAAMYAVKRERRRAR